MKYFVLALLCLAVTGCTSTITHYDQNGKITKVEEATNFYYLTQSTSKKSQVLMIDGTYVNFAVSTTADKGTPGMDIKFANGRTAIINQLPSNQEKSAWADLFQYFFGKFEITKDGIKK